MKRISYIKLNEFQSMSKDPIKITGGYASAMFDVSNKTFKIVAIVTNNTLSEGTATSPHKLKIKIKQALKVLGADFGIEKRYAMPPEGN